MPTSSYMPDVKVEIAFNGGFRVPMADWTWTDVSNYVELGAGIGGSWCRGDERSTADANTLTLTFDNSDGRFTSGRITSPYYPEVKLYKPIRVLADPVDGTQVPLFTGYITSWPVEWEDTSAYARATVTAASRLARLGLNARFRSIIEETILTAGPVAYYPLGDPDGSTLAADASGNAAAPLVPIGTGTGVVFGQATGPGTDGLTAATFAGGQFLAGEPTTGGADQSAVIFFNRTGAPSSTERLMTGGPLSYLKMNSSGFITSVAPLTSSVSYADGETHCAAITYDNTAGLDTWTLYVDGIAVDSINGSGGGTTRLTVGGIGDSSGDAAFTGTLAHAAYFDTCLTPAQVAAIATAGLSAWAGEATDARFLRYAAMVGVDAAEVSAETGSTTMIHIDTTDQNAVDLLRITETTEAGVMFDALDGTLTLHNRGHRYGGASVLTLDMAKHEVESDYSPKLDPSSLVNDITATGVTTAHVVDAASVEAYGVATASISTASENDTEPLALAGWAKYKYAEPKPRVASLSVDVTNQAAFFAEGESTVSSADLLAVTIGDRITVANHPQQAALSITDYFVEGGSFAIGPESFKVTWNVSPTDAEDAVFILDSATQGVLDTNVLGL